MTYILILMFSYGPHHIEFSSQQMCENARVKLSQMNKFYYERTICVPK